MTPIGQSNVKHMVGEWAVQLQRTIERLLVTHLARYLVTHPGLKDVTIKADLSKDRKIVFGAIP